MLVAEDKARFKVVVCGRQWGKTLLGGCAVVEEASKGGDAWWVAPSFPVGDLGWRIIDHLCRQIPGSRFEGRPVFRITLPSGGTIQLRSADNPDSLRGATLNLVVFDEAAMAKPEAWSTLRPTLSAREGRAMFISTPKGLNWFHDLFQDAADRVGWERWRFPSVENPYLPPEDIELARGEMSSLVFSQEYEADFVSYGSGMFQAEWLQHYRTHFVGEDRILMLGEEAVPVAGCQVFHTVDLAWSMEERADYTVISTWAITPKRHLALLDCQRGHFEGPDIVPKLRYAWDKWGGTHIGVEKATRQMGIIEEAARTGLPVKDLRADKDKVARALPATARMERRTVWFPAAAASPWVTELTDELLAFPAGRHDDFVDTLSYACLELMNQSVYEQRGVRSV
jgi:predicted phage terminase large subunit-like protein